MIRLPWSSMFAPSKDSTAVPQLQVFADNASYRLVVAAFALISVPAGWSLWFHDNEHVPALLVFAACLTSALVVMVLLFPRATTGKAQDSSATSAHAGAGLYDPSPNQLRVTDLVIRRSASGQILWSNAAFLALTDQTLDQLRGQDFQAVLARLTPENDALRTKDWQSVLSSHGMLLWYDWQEHLVSPETGSDLVIETIGRDITAAKQTELQLLQAREIAEHASDAKSRFLRTVSHEMRTPLNGILGMGSLLRQTRLTPEQVSYTQAIETSGQALLTLIEDLLDFAKIEAGRIDLHPASVCLSQHIEGLVEFLAPRAYAKNIELACFVDPTIPACLELDPHRLRQILINLAGNAIKFTNQGGVTIEVRRIEEGATTGQCVLHFSVRDTGIGIAPEDIKRVFREFEQVDLGASRAYEGTGLGLAIARRLVHMMGGDIKLESVLGQGSVFEFTLQLTHSPGSVTLPESGSPMAQGAGLVTTGTEFAGRSIVIVSDSRIEVPHLLQHMKRWGAETRQISPNAIRRALPVCDREPDIVIVDAACSDPMDILASLRELVSSKLGVALMPSQRPLLQDWLDGGFEGYLIRPVRPQSLFSVLRFLLGGENFAPVERMVHNQWPVAEQPLRILVCDDNEINLLLARSLLEKLGHHATCVAEGRRALTLLQDNPIAFDLVLMDLHMPEWDGFEVIRQISAHFDTLPDKVALPIIALTADAMPETLEKCMHAGFTKCLTKPIDPTLLIEVLEQLASRTS